MGAFKYRPRTIEDWEARAFQTADGFERPTLESRAQIAIRNWLEPISWQLIFTLTFPWHARAETAQQKFRDFMNALERHYRNRICFFFVLEQDARSGIGYHLHGLLASVVLLDTLVIERFWREQISYGNQPAGSRKERQSADVEAYDPSGPWIRYCVKKMNDALGNWEFNHLREFNRHIPGTRRPNHKTVKSARRAAEQARRAMEN